MIILKGLKRTIAEEPYYGDEYGMHGLMDPFNRGAFFENDKETYQEVLRLTSLRNREKV